MIITIANQKGGVAKTTTALNTAAGLSRYYGKKVLLIDLDPQCNLTDSANAAGDPGIVEFLQGSPEAIQHMEYFDFIAGSEQMSIFDKMFNSRTNLLKQDLKSLAKSYDIIILDTPPALNLITINALIASDGIIIPATPERRTLQGLSQINETISTVKRNGNRNLKTIGILITKMNRRKSQALMVEQFQTAAERMKTSLFNTRIREGRTCGESDIMQQDIFTYDEKSAQAQEYKAYLEELMQRI